MTRTDKDRWTMNLLQWIAWANGRNTGCPPNWWTNDIQETAGMMWTTKTQNKSNGRDGRKVSFNCGLKMAKRKSYNITFKFSTLKRSNTFGNCVESLWTWDTCFAFAPSNTCPKFNGFVKQFNQELCISSIAKVFHQETLVETIKMIRKKSIYLI